MSKNSEFISERIIIKCLFLDVAYGYNLAFSIFLSVFKLFLGIFRYFIFNEYFYQKNNFELF